jgi:hypothetical protein
LAGSREATITAINAPEPDKGFGWIIVRHHHSAELAEGYAAAMWDLERALLPFNELHCPVYEVRGQFFTLLHRPPIEGRASPAMNRVVRWERMGRAFQQKICSPSEFGSRMG